MKKWLIEKLDGKEKLITAGLTIPIIAAGTMSGACAAGCPYGLVNDPYPGQCPRYIDVTGDGICDLSQAASSVATTQTSATNSDNSNSAAGDHAANGSYVDTNTVNSQDNVNASALSDSGSGLNSFGDGGGYHVLPISILLLGGYFFTYFLFNKGILSRQKHRRLWNLLLTAGYAGTGITGLLLILIINLGIKTALNPDITFWHGELAILMVITTLIHLHIYRKPVKRMFKIIFGSTLMNKKRSHQSKNSK